MKKCLLILLLLATSLFNLMAQIPATGLIGYWPLNGNANDSTGNGYNGIVTNATLTTDRFGNQNGAYSFGDTSKYITIADAVPLRLNNTDFTISLWFNQDTILSSQEALITKRISGNQNGYILNITGTAAPKIGLLNYQVSGGVDPKVQTDSVLAIKTWHHIAIVYTFINLRLRIYVDGIKHADTAGIPAPNANTTANMIIGKDGATGFYPFHGTIDDIALYNRALSITEIHQIISPCDTVNITSNIVAQYDFVGNANDISGNSHNGTVTGALLTTDRFGNTNNAYTFNGSTSTISVPDDSTLRLSNTDYTISTWINQTTVAATNAAIISKHTGAGQRGYFFNVSGTGTTPPRRLSFNVSSGSDPKAISDSIISISAWHHVVEVYDLGSHTIYTYIDGLLNNSKAGIPSLNPTTTANMYFGSDGVGLPYYFNGKIDDIRIYNRALSSCDVDSLYNLPYLLPSGINNLTAKVAVELFPNPAKDYFTISNFQSGIVTIGNTFGQLVKSATITSVNTKVNIAELPAGIYFVSIKIDKHKTLVKKMIKY